MQLASGTELGYYVIQAPLGAGGMAEVYRAEDTRLGRDVAIKVLPDDFARNAERLARFEREARLLAALNHPNVVTIYAVEEVEGVRFLSMELVDGRPLSDVQPEGGMALKDFFNIAVPLTDAIAAAHAKGITHRDLKPANVMLTDEGRVKVLDFGLGKRGGQVEENGDDASQAPTQAMTQVGMVMGTVPYMSPEQLEGKPVDRRTDVFSLGVLLYELLTGTRPFDGPSSAALISSILRDVPLPPGQHIDSLPAPLDRLIIACLEKDPLNRAMSAAELHAGLSDVRHQVESSQVAVEAPAATPRQDGGERFDTYRTALVGRDAEAQELRDWLGQAGDGFGNLVMVAGEPGVGKTRLTWELMQEARKQGFLSLVGHCYEMEGSPPFIPWVEILETTARIAQPEALRRLLGDEAPEIAKLQPGLRRLFPDMPPPLELPKEEERRYLFNGFQAFIERASHERPLVLVLEDLHWADESSLLLMAHLARAIADQPILMIGTYREVELDVHRPLARILQELVRERVAQRISLKRFPPRAVAEMLRELSGHEPPPGLVEAIHRSTEGNPFFVEEVYLHLEEEGRLFDRDGSWRQDLSLDTLDVPEGVRLVVGRRIEQLSESGQRVLTAAAVLGRQFSYNLLEALARMDEDEVLDAIESAESLQLIQPASATAREASYLFAHELIRQTLIGSLSLPRLQRLHLNVAQTLEKVYANDLDSHASMLSHHLYQAGAAADEEKTVHFLTVAGDRALESAAFDEAEKHFDLALSLQEVERGPLVAELLHKRGTARRSLGSWTEAIEDWKKAFTCYEQVGAEEALASLGGELSFLLAWKARPEESVDIARRSLAAVSDEPTDYRCGLLAEAAAALGYAGQHQAACDMNSDATALAEQLGNEDKRGLAVRTQALMHWLYPDMVRFDEIGREACVLLKASGYSWLLTELLSILESAAVMLGDWERLGSIDRELTPLIEQLGALGPQAMQLRARRMRNWLHEPQLGRFKSESEEDLDLCRRADMPWIAQSYTALGLHDFLRGDGNAALEWLTQAVEAEPQGVYEGADFGFLILLEAYLGNRDNALSRLAERRHQLPEPGPVVGGGPAALLVLVVESMAVIGEFDKAAELYPAVVELIALGTPVAFTPVPWHLLETVAAIAASAGGNWSVAETHFATAMRQAEEFPFETEKADIRRWQAEMLLRRRDEGDLKRAASLLREAIEAYEGFAFPKYVELAEKMLTAAGE